MSTITTINAADLITNSRATINTNFSNLNTDKVEGAALSVDSEVALFSGVGGKTIKRASASGIAKLTSGVLSAVTAPAGAIVGDSDTQALTNKTVNGLTITSTTGTLTVTAAKTLSVSNTITLAGTDGTTMTFPTTNATIARTDAANTFTGHQTIEGVTSTGATGTGKFVFDTSPTLVTPVLGTPTSGTLTNCTGLPIAGLTASTATALGVGSIELGHASDTTIARVSAGVISVEGVTIPSISSTDTLTNKRITKRTGSTTSSATPTINTDTVDMYLLTAQAVDITSFTTNLSGTPTEGQLLWISITGTAARAITWGTSFEASTVALPTTTVTTARLDVGFVWNSATSKWRCIASA